MRPKAGSRRGRSAREEVRQPLTEQAYTAIKREILSDRLAPGVPLPVDRFTREMKLSRTPVREAILRLEREGFVEIKPRLGTFVAHLDLRKIREMYHVRAVLEGSAARLTAALYSPAALKTVDKELRSQKLTGTINLAAISEAGQSLHRMIVDECGNEVLAGTIRSLQDHFSRYRHFSLQISEKVLSSHREHLEILDALSRRDGELAERLVRAHFEHAARFLIESALAQAHANGSLRLMVSAAR